MSLRTSSEAIILISVGCVAVFIITGFAYTSELGYLVEHIPESIVGLRDKKLSKGMVHLVSKTGKFIQQIVGSNHLE
jgi:hypothetical protein